MNANSIKAVIFDIGGVLVRTVDRSPREKLAASFGLTYQELDQIVFNSQSAFKATIGEIKESTHWRAVADHFGLRCQEIQNFQKQFWAGDVLDGELIEFVETLIEKVQLGILSNAWSGARDFMTERYGFLDLFDPVIFSAERKTAKPDPRSFLYILKKMKVKPEETLFIDDFIENIEAAKKLGIHAIQFKNTPQTIQAIRSCID